MKIKIGEICLYGILGVLLFALKFVMASLPNVEPVSFFLIVYTIAFGIKTLYPLAVYVCLEILIYGFGFWSVAYLYIWLVLVFATLIAFKITKHSMNSLLYAAISCLFGLFFGALYIPLYVVSGGFAFAVTWWISGLPYDIIHGVANFILCIILFKPITKAVLILKQQIIKTK